MKLRSASLYYAIIIALLIALTCSAFISFIYFQLYEHQYYETNNRLINEAYSGIELTKSSSFLVNDIQQIQFSKLNKDSLYLKKMKWGIYDLVYSKAFYKKNFIEKCALLGVHEANKLQNIALYISNNNKSIGISGSTEIIGDAFVSSNGFKRNYIETKSTIISNFLQGKQIESKSELIPLSTNEVINILSNYDRNENDSTIELNEIQNLQLNQSFSNQSILIYSKNDIYLDNINLTGNIKINSNRSIIIGKNAHLNQVILIAKYITIQKDASICAQLIASDSIFIDDRASLAYPSSIFIKDKNQINNFNKFLIIAKDCSIKGEIYLLNNTNNTLDQSYCFIDEGSKIEGLIYSNAYTCIFGEIYGSAYLHKLLVKNTSAIYENQLLNAKFNKQKQNKHFLWSPLLNEKTEKSIMQWLD